MANYEWEKMFGQALQSKLGRQDAQARLANEQASAIQPQLNLDRAKFRDAAAFDRQKLFMESADPFNPNQDRALESIYSGFTDDSYYNTAAPRRSALDAYSSVGLDEPMYGYSMGGQVAAGYPAYIKAMNGKNAMSPQQYAQAAGQVLAQRAKQQAIARNAGQTQLYANGGMVTPELEDVGGAMLEGPGYGKSDSIPAMIDGQQPAALSKGEFVIPRHVVEYFGTKHFDQLVEKARMAGKKKAKKGAI